MRPILCTIVSLLLWTSTVGAAGFDIDALAKARTSNIPDTQRDWEVALGVSVDFSFAQVSLREAIGRTAGDSYDNREADAGINWRRAFHSLKYRKIGSKDIFLLSTTVTFRPWPWIGFGATEQWTDANLTNGDEMAHVDVRFRKSVSRFGVDMKMSYDKGKSSTTTDVKGEITGLVWKNFTFIPYGTFIRSAGIEFLDIWGKLKLSVF